MADPRNPYGETIEINDQMHLALVPFVKGDILNPGRPWEPGAPSRRWKITNLVTGHPVVIENWKTKSTALRHFLAIAKDWQKNGVRDLRGPWGTAWTKIG